MTTIVTRAGKGSPLTNDEMDQNLINLNNDKLEVSTAGTTYAPINSPTFTGDPKAPNPLLGDNDTSLATTSWVNTAITNDASHVKIAGDTMTGNLNIPSLNGGQLAGFRNKIINGNFRVDQRAMVPYTNPAGTYTIDQWVANFASGNVRQLSNTSGYYMSLQGISGGGHVLQRIEDVRTLAGKKATLSFRVAANAAVNLVVYLGQNFGAGGSATVDGIGQTDVAITNVLTKYSVTFDVPSVSGKTIGTGSYLKVDFSFPTGFSAADLYDVQLEEGSIATPFESTNIGYQLDSCRRYYRVYATVQNTADLGYQMRVVPTQAGAGPYTYTAEL